MKIKTLQFKKIGNTLSVTDGAINAAIHNNAPTEFEVVFFFCNRRYPRQICTSEKEAIKAVQGLYEAAIWDKFFEQT